MIKNLKIYNNLHPIKQKFVSPYEASWEQRVQNWKSILSRKTGKEVYWEHDGKMDDPKYSEKAVRKINSYIYNGIIPGDRLMLTFETSNIVLNDRTIKKMIDNFLL